MLTRRQALTGAAAGVTLPALAACGEQATSPDEGADASSGASTPAGGALVAVADVPVGGGVILTEENLVVTQPTEGEFKGYSASCPHQGCAVTRIEEGEIICPCHFSRFAIADGAVLEGPATEGLQEAPIAVDGDTVTYAD